MKYRDRIDIIADILNVAIDSAKKTRLMYQANLSYNVMQKYLSEITKASLVTYQTETHSFALTSKGREFLDYYRDYSRMLNLAEKQVKRVAARRKVLESLCADNC
jgi:predicted transcriptional regulator